MEKIKKAVKQRFPKLSQAVFKLKLQFINRKYKNMTLEDTWDDLYQAQMARNETQLSGAGSYGKLAEHYAAFLKKIIKDYKIKTITDIGCGDFNVGSKLHKSVRHYNALDVSAAIIRRNKKKFSDRKNVSFFNRNGCVDKIPQADLVTVRQVMQHLTNAEIKAILTNIEKSGSKYALIAEHCYSLEKTRKPNLDLNHHGNHIRVIDQSGVFISLPPFSKKAKLLKKFPIQGVKDEYLYLFLWEPLSGR
jgi:predicted TPR repeat methyltransferase